jgi:hypothetical protein
MRCYTTFYGETLEDSEESPPSMQCAASSIAERGALRQMIGHCCLGAAH